MRIRRGSITKDSAITWKKEYRREGPIVGFVVYLCFYKTEHLVVEVVYPLSGFAYFLTICLQQDDPKHQQHVGCNIPCCTSTKAVRAIMMLYSMRLQQSCL